MSESGTPTPEDALLELPGGEVPTREELLAIAKASGGRLASGELAKRLGLRGAERAKLKAMVRTLKREGLVGGRAQAAAGSNGPPKVAFVEVTEVDEDGEAWGESPALPGVSIRLINDKGTAPGLGERALVRPEVDDDGSVVGRVFKVLRSRPRGLIGLVEAGPKNELWLQPTGRDKREPLRLLPGGLDLRDGDMVRAEAEATRSFGAPCAVALERLGRADEPRVISLAVALELELPMEFSPEALAQAEAAQAPALGRRVDLRGHKLVTIDGADARDFDDAVLAWPDLEPDNPGGYVALVAIADVANYVTPGSPLDEAAYDRGNSVYFPDRVIPMLPEALSNGLCSLKPDEDRACLACEMRIDAQGELKAWRFARGLMRSAARLTYDQAQEALDGNPDPRTAELLDDVIRPLHACFEALLAARRRRGTIELDVPERTVRFDQDRTTIEAIEPRRRSASHMIVEELMIAANVAAAKTLAKKNVDLLYRVHDKPDGLKLESLADYAAELNISWNRQAKKPGDFTRLLNKIEDASLREQVSTMILRSQAQARYQPDNIGHFGLNLTHYAHFTSPIRRYSDLTLHRQLIRHLDLSEQHGGAAYDFEELDKIGDQVSATERTAVDAERRAMSRYVALFMSEHVGASFVGRVASVQRFGLFVALDDTGAEGLVPVSSLGREFFVHDERRHLLIGERGGDAYGPGDKVKVTLLEADQARGMLLFRLDDHEPSAATQAAVKGSSKGLKPVKGGRGKGSPRRSGTPKGGGRGKRPLRGR